MNRKRRVFVEEYLRCWNATKAARRAGYAHPGSQGHRLLNIVEIDAEIQRRISEKAMSANEVVTRLADQARGDIADSLNIDGNYVIVDIAKLKELGLTHLIKKFKQTKQGIEVEFYDAQAALVHLGKVHGIFNKSEPGTDEQPLRIQVLEWGDVNPSRDISD